MELPSLQDMKLPDLSLLGEDDEEPDEMELMRRRIEGLESHIDAVDSALQDFIDENKELLGEEFDLQEKELEELKQLIERRQIESGEKEQRIAALESRYRLLDNKVDQEVEDVVETIETMTEKVKENSQKLKQFKEKNKNIEERLEKLESEFIAYRNNQEYDLKKKLNQRDYEEDREEIMNEIGKLRASVNSLANELDSEDIEIEESE